MTKLMSQCAAMVIVVNHFARARFIDRIRRWRWVHLSSNGSVCQTRLWRKPSSTHRCTVNSISSIPLALALALADCPTRAPFFAGATGWRNTSWHDQIPATVNELQQRRLLLNVGAAVDATRIAVPSSTKNKDKARDPEMHSSQKGNEWHFGMKALGPGAHRVKHLEQRGRCHRGQQLAPWSGDGRVR